MIVSRTFAFMSRLSLETLDPNRSYQAMHKMLISNLNLSKSKSTENLLKKLLKLGIGTPEVEKFSSICAGQSIGKKYDRSLVLFAMKKKVEDAEWATRQAKHQFLMRLSPLSSLPSS